jgi:hypothetical protein
MSKFTDKVDRFQWLAEHRIWKSEADMRADIEREYAALAARVHEFESLFCEAHQPAEGDIRACPYCEAVHLSDKLAELKRENERLREQLDLIKKQWHAYANFPVGEDHPVERLALHLALAAVFDAHKVDVRGGKIIHKHALAAGGQEKPGGND